MSRARAGAGVGTGTGKQVGPGTHGAKLGGASLSASLSADAPAAEVVAAEVVDAEVVAAEVVDEYDAPPVLAKVSPVGQGPVLFSSLPQRGVRGQPGERLDQLFEERCDRLRTEGRGGRLAVDAGGTALTYDELDASANRLACHLIARGARPGDKIALLFDDSVPAYVGMLAVLKVHAAYVPLDAGFPADRISYIIADADVTTVLTLTHLADRLLPEVAAPVVRLDGELGQVGELSPRRLSEAERGEPVGVLAYIIYTSGSTGWPNCVAVAHPSICNFVRVAADVYGMRTDDRIYQGMTIAFDFSFEEIWVPWMSGATMVPKPAGPGLLGADLADFITQNAITALCCVPTLLATLEEDLPGLRFLMVSGEACPRDLVVRWHRPGRRFLNVYGPTEATVTATWGVADPDRPVTLGTPLPTYAAVILDPIEGWALPQGELGEPRTPTEEALAAALAEVLGLERVSTDTDFFAGLGANSLLMAHFCARVRKNGGLPPVSMREIYESPTIAGLAAVLEAGSPGFADIVVEAAPAEIQHRATTAQYVLCGALQVIITLGYTYLMAAVLITGNQWVMAAPEVGWEVARTVVVGVVMFLALSIIPIVLKWVLIGRWKIQEIPIWSLAYVGFWFVKTVVNITPMRMFIGTPVYPFYLRALGAKVGRNVTIFASSVPVCTDLVSIGDGTVIRKEVTFSGYRARAGRIQTGPVTLGRNVLIGEAIVLDIDTAMGDNAVLGHASSLHSSRRVPAGQTWHGSPAQPSTTNHRVLEQSRRHRSTRRRFTFGCWTILTRGVLASPLGVAADARRRQLPGRPLSGTAGLPPAHRVQTGSNTGVDFTQDNPHLITLGSGTMISDALSIMNADYSSTSPSIPPSAATRPTRSPGPPFASYRVGTEPGSGPCRLTSKGEWARTATAPTCSSSTGTSQICTGVDGGSPESHRVRAAGRCGAAISSALGSKARPLPVALSTASLRTQ